MTGYFDEWDFRPYVTAIPMRDGMTPKGAVLLMAGGAYRSRGSYTDALTTTAALREYVFQTFQKHPAGHKAGKTGIFRRQHWHRMPGLRT